MRWHIWSSDQIPYVNGEFMSRSTLLAYNCVCIVIFVAVLSVSCILVVTCLEKADLLALLCVVFSCVSVTFPYASWSISELRVRLV